MEAEGWIERLMSPSSQHTTSEEAEDVLRLIGAALGDSPARSGGTTASSCAPAPGPATAPAALGSSSQVQHVDLPPQQAQPLPATEPSLQPASNCSTPPQPPIRFINEGTEVAGGPILLSPDGAPPQLPPPLEPWKPVWQRRQEARRPPWAGARGEGSRLQAAAGIERVMKLWSAPCDDQGHQQRESQDARCCEDDGAVSGGGKQAIVYDVIADGAVSATEAPTSIPSSAVCAVADGKAAAARGAPALATAGCGGWDGAPPAREAGKLLQVMLVALGDNVRLLLGPAPLVG